MTGGPARGSYVQTQKLVLASTSPYRRALLERLRLDFDTFAPDLDESTLAGESPMELVSRLSEAKARAAAGAFPDHLIIGSDQVAVLDERIIGKPADHAAAVEQLRHASGRCVEFLTGLCLYNSASDRVQLGIVPFDVVFRSLSGEQIERYLRQDEPYNCAGSFRAESLGITLFEKMSGDDPNALLGLPLIRLTEMLNNEGVDLP